jgi:hypothetical protein
VYFGGNDCFPPHPSGLGTHVPLGEYIENLRKIAIYIKVKVYYYFYFKFQNQFESLLKNAVNCVQLMVNKYKYITLNVCKYNYRRHILSYQKNKKTLL